MQRARACAGMGIGLMLGAASTTWAGQLDLSLENRLGYESNVFRAERDREKDGTHEIIPRLGVRDDTENLGYSFDYQPSYRTFFGTSGISGLDHIARGRTTWTISPVDRLELTGAYVNSRQFIFGNRDLGAGVTTFDVNDRERIRQSDANLAYRRALTQRLSVRLDAFLDDFDASGTDDQSQNDSLAYTGRIATQYVLDPLTEIGVTVSGRRRENRAVGLFRVSSVTDVWDVMGSVSRQITPTIGVSVQAGPSFINQEQLARGAYTRDPSIPGSQCNENTPLPPDPLSQCIHFPKDESNDVTLFAVVSANKEWKQSEAEVSYVRSEARSGTANSSSSIADRLQLQLTHRFHDRFFVVGTVGWDHYDQLFRQQDDDGKIVLDTYRMSATTEYSLNRNIALTAQYSYFRQENEVKGGVDSVNAKIDIHVGYVGVRFNLEPLSY